MKEVVSHYFSVLFNCRTMSLEEFVVVDDDSMCTAPITVDRDISEIVQSLNNIIDINSDDENEMDNAARVLK
ncbi:hypothetical protein TNCV_4622551 [Trichonephila clavipes]|nr:hypothetical protein TNCV_4622551 [Trichonephila clavipes]